MHKFNLNYGKIRVSVICTVIMFAATFAPMIHIPHRIVLEEFSNDFSGYRWSILSFELLSLGLNLFGLTRWAWYLLGMTFLDLIGAFSNIFDIVIQCNKSLDSDAFLHIKERYWMSWGWIVIFIGPLLMAGVYYLEYREEHR